MPREIHWIWAAIGAVLMGAAMVWWMHSPSDRASASALGTHGNDASRNVPGPTLYRWIDARGVLNITDTPPQGRHYTVVRIDPDRNLLPSANAAAAGASGAAPAPR